MAANLRRTYLLRCAACASLLQVVLLLGALCNHAGAQDQQQQQLYFMFISSSAASFNTSGSRLAVDLAVADVNADGLLANYSLNFTAGDSRVSV